jgi:hypothetical protein
MIIYNIKLRKEEFISNKIIKILKIISEIFAIGEPRNIHF